MANTKISAEAAATTLTGTELILGVQAGGNVKITASQLAALAGGSIAIAASAWVETGGNDATGVLGNPAKPFATLDAAFNALPSTGGDIHVGIGTFAPVSGDFLGTSITLNAGSVLKSYTRILGSGMPRPDSETAPTTLVGTSGTVIKAPFAIHSTHHYIQLFDLGIDGGSAVCSALYGGSAVNVLLWANVGQINSLAQNLGARAENVMCLAQYAGAAVHSGPMFENCLRPYSKNTKSWFGTHGFSAKSIGGIFSGIDSRGHSAECVIFKESNDDNDTAPCYDNVMSDVVMGEIGTGDTPVGLSLETASTRPLERISISNVVAKGITTYDIKTAFHSTGLPGLVKNVRITGFYTSNGAIRYSLASHELGSILVNGAVPTAQTLTYAASVAVNAGYIDNFYLTLAGNSNLANPTNMVEGRRYKFFIGQDGTGGRSLALGSKFLTPGGASLAFSSIANAKDLMTCDYSAAQDALYCRLETAFAVMNTASPNPTFSNVKLSLHAEGANGSTTFTDSSLSARVATVIGNAQLSTALSVVGGASSALYDGTDDNLTFPNSADFHFGSGDFCIRFWYYPTTLVQGQCILGEWGSQLGWIVAHGAPSIPSTQIRFVASANGGYDSTTYDRYANAVSLTLNAWNFCVVQRKSSVIAFGVGLVGGGIAWDSAPVQTGGAASAGPSITIGSPTTQVLNVGCGAGGTASIIGNLKEVQIIKGEAPYTTSTVYSVPTAAFPNV